MKNYIRVLLKIGNDWFKVYGIEASEKQVIVPSPLKLSEDYGHGMKCIITILKMAGFTLLLKHIQRERIMNDLLQHIVTALMKK